MFNPITASESIKQAYVNYLVTTLNFEDAEYRRLFKNALEEDGAIAKGPYLDVSGAYEKGESISEMIDSPLFRNLESCPESEKGLKIERQLFLHQQQAVERAAKGSSLVVTTGTGSGKTECFIIPILNELLREKENGTLNPGVRAIVIYPMKALAADQQDRLRKILRDFEDITFGVYDGNTPNDIGASSNALKNECASRTAIRENPPHILITNYSMLEYTLLRPKDDIIFHGANLKYIVLDEAHVYKGATGIETALLMRRLRARLNAAENVRYILTSATLGGKESNSNIIAFMKNLCDADICDKDIIRSSEKCPELKDNIEFQSEMFTELVSADKTTDVLNKYNADFAPEADSTKKLFELCLHSALYEQLCAVDDETPFDDLYNIVSKTCDITPDQLKDFMDICARAFKHSTEKCPEMKDNIEFPAKMFTELVSADKTAEVLNKYNADFAPEADSNEKLFELCLHSALFGQFRLATENPVSFVELYDIVSKIRKITPDQLKDFIDICARAFKDGYALVKPRYHYFTKSIDGAFVTLNTPKQLFLERKTRDDATDQCIFEAGICKNCGRLAVMGKADKKLKQSSESYNAYIVQHESEDLLYDDEEIDEETGSSKSEFVLCPKCGAIKTKSDVVGEKLCSCKEDPITVFEAELTDAGYMKCRACDNGIIDKLYVGNTAVTQVLATELFEQLPNKVTVKREIAEISSEDNIFGGAEAYEIIEEKSLFRQFLCFSDSRREASYFAPRMEDSYTQIIKRRCAWRVADELRDEDKESVSVPYFVDKLTEKFIDNGVFGYAEAKKQAWLEIIDEMTCISRSIGLVPLGAFAFTYNGHKPEDNTKQYVDRSNKRLAENISSNVGIPPKEAQNLLDLLVMDMVCRGAINCPPARIEADEAKELFYTSNPEGFWLKVQGDKNKKGSGKKNNSWLPVSTGRTNNRMERVKRDLCGNKKYAENSGASNFLTQYYTMLAKNNGKNDPNNEELLINISDFEIELGRPFYRCDICGRVTPYNVQNHCSNVRCKGMLSEYNPSEDMDNHYVNIYHGGQLEPMKIKEHTAQLDTKTAKEYQEAFRDHKLNALSCSTTFEMGVDLGSLETVFMRDIPPTPANYTQRAGRAGRSTHSTAFVLTHAKRSPHDYTFYNEPIKMISGKITAPKFALENKKIISRHIYAVALAGFFKSNEEVYNKSNDNLEYFIETGYEEFKKYLAAKPQILKECLIASVPKNMHEAMGINDYSWNELLVGENNGVLERAVRGLKGEAEAIQAQIDSKTGDHQKLETQKHRLFKNGNMPLIDFLARNNVLPKYGFPVDVVQMSTNSIANSSAKAVDLNRDLQLAIAEYAPGSEVVADGNTYTSKYIKTFRNGDEWRRGAVAYCQECKEVNFIASEKDELDFEVRNCVHCGAEIEKADWRRTIEPSLGFVSLFQSGTRKYAPKHGQKTEDYYVGDGSGDMITKAEYEILGKHITLESTVNDSLVVLSRSFYRVCPFCGWAEMTDDGTQKGKKKKFGKHKNMYGPDCRYDGPGIVYRLSHDFKTDVVQMTFISDNAINQDVMLSVLYAILEGLSKSLDIERSDVKGCLFKKFIDGKMLYSLIIYDSAAGGAGHVRRLVTKDGKQLASVLKAALDHVTKCTCDQSCYSCLRNYNNQIYHDKLNRHCAADFLKEWQGTAQLILE